MTRPLQKSLLARKVAPISLGLFAHSDSLARRGVPGSLQDLANHDVIGFDTETPAIRALAKHFPDCDRAAFALRVDSDVAQLPAIRAGFGIGVCQVPVAARGQHLVRVLAASFTVDLEVWIVMHEDLGNSLRCRTVFDALVAAFDRR